MFESSAQAILVLQNQRLPEHQRTEAAHFLASDPTPETLTALVAALSDADHGVRWAAGTVLAEIGDPAMPVLLNALIQPGVDKTLRDGVRHVLVLEPLSLQLPPREAVAAEAEKPARPGKRARQ